MANRGSGRINKDANAPQGGKNYLLVIGIDKYQKAPILYNAVRDAKTFAEILTNHYNFEKENVQELYDEMATRTNILQAFREQIKKLTPSDNLVIYFSGHGAYDEVLDEGFWLPVESEIEESFNYIANALIVKYIKAIKSRHTLLVVDSCFSGALFVERNLTNVKLEESIPSRWAFTSGRKEPVLDGKPGDHSPFAENLLYFLKNHGLSYLPVIELMERVKRGVGANATQLPRGAVIHGVGDKGGQFFFHKKRDETADWKQALESDTISGFQRYLAAYPTGSHTKDAKAQIESLRDKAAWETAKKSNTIPAYLKYERQYPQGQYINQALAAIVQLEEEALWKHVRRRDTIGGYREYLGKYPEGKFADLARQALEQKYKAYESGEPAQEKDKILDKSKSSTSKTVDSPPNFSETKPRTFVRPGPSKDRPKAKTTQKIEAKLWVEGIMNRWLIGASVGTILLMIWIFWPQPSLPKRQANDVPSTPITVEARPSSQPIATVSKGMMTDPADGQTYQVIELADGNLWMAENLNYEINIGSYCYYDDLNRCNDYGRLYTWEAAQQACPNGWHLPTDEEWREMAKKYGGADYDANDGGKAAYDALFEGGDSGFAALLGGRRDSNGSYFDLGTGGYYWTSTESGTNGAWFYFFFDGKLWRYFDYYRTYGRSVRCLQD